METGVRELERCIDSIFRKVIIESENNKLDEYLIDDVTMYLGNYKYKYLHNDKGSEVGVVNTLGYTPYGGCLLKTTSVMYSGNGSIQLTGSLGDVIKESVYVAMGYIRANNNILDIDNNVFLTNDFHIHFESGSVFKEGPSAGVSLITSILSLIKNKRYCGLYDSDLYKAIANGISLPKGHGRLIDADALDIPINICDGFEAMDYIDGIDTIIEADKEKNEDDNN
jgi:ATP-dependent Lon protease